MIRTIRMIRMKSFLKLDENHNEWQNILIRMMRKERDDFVD